MCHELRKLMAIADLRRPARRRRQARRDRRNGYGRLSEQPRTPRQGIEQKPCVRHGGTRRQDARWPDPGFVTRSRWNPIVLGHVKEGTSPNADEWDSYNDLKHGFDLGARQPQQKTMGCSASTIRTRLRAIGRHFKRAVRGTHVHISAKHHVEIRRGVHLSAQLPRSRTKLCLIVLWPLSRCHVYKTCEIL